MKRNDAGVLPAAARARPTVAQAWIEPVADDPEALSALGVARRCLGAEGLRSLRRARLIELEGALPPAAELAARLHDSTRFYNPNKERCHLRVSPADPAPLAPGERAVLVFDRGGERREGSERWWKRATGARIRVREGTAWIFAAGSAEEAEALLGGLTEVEDLRHGLLCNPHAQESRRGGDAVPIEWFAAKPERVRRKR